METAELTGSRWVAVRVADQAALTGFIPSAAFELDGRVYGSTGINRFSASYHLVGDELSFGEAMTTLMAGPPDAMLQEQAWLRVLSSPCRVRRDGELLLIDGDAATLVLRPDPGSALVEV